MASLLFRPCPTGWLNEHVFAIAQRSMVNLFLIRIGSGAIAIDTGLSARSIEATLCSASAGDSGCAADAPALAGMHLSSSAVHTVLLTHTDRDHVGGLGAFPRATVYLGGGEEALLTRARTRFWGLTHVPRLHVPYVALSDGQELYLDGVRVLAVATPGHTLGSMSYLIDGQWLFTGDTIALREGVARPFYGLFDMDRSVLRRSIAKLAQLPHVSLLCTAHTGCTSDWDRAMAAWRTATQ